MKDETALGILAALSHPDRLALVKALVKAEPNGVLAGQLAAQIGASPSKTSFHLSTLSRTGLVWSEKQAREVTYRVAFSALGGLVRYLLEDCCGNHPGVTGCCRQEPGP